MWSSHSVVDQLASGLLLQITKSTRETALAASSLVAMHRAGGGDTVVLLLAFLEGSFSRGHILGLDGFQEGIYLRLDDSLTPAVACATVLILTNLLFPGLCIWHELISTPGPSGHLEISSRAVSQNPATGSSPEPISPPSDRLWGPFSPFRSGPRSLGSGSFWALLAHSRRCLACELTPNPDTLLRYAGACPGRPYPAGIAQLDRASVYETEGSRFESWYPRSGALKGVQSRIHVGLMTRNAFRGAPKCLIVRADVRAETGRPLVGSGL